MKEPERMNDDEPWEELPEDMDGPAEGGGWEDDEDFEDGAANSSGLDTDDLIEQAREKLREANPDRKRDPKLEVLHDAPGFQAIQKPAGLTSIQERWDPNLPTVIDELWKMWLRDDPDAPRPHVVHRLDKDTSGLILFAKNRPTQAELRRQFRERTVKKTYRALTRGAPALPAGRIEIRVEPARQPGRMRVTSKGGKDCETDYRVIERLGDLGWVELYPLQGRTHQIRLCLMHLGHPCAIDPMYGSKDPIYLSQYKRRYSPRRGHPERPLIERLTLHAAKLELQDPKTGAQLLLEAPEPRDLAATLKQLRRWSRGN